MGLPLSLHLEQFPLYLASSIPEGGKVYSIQVDTKKLISYRLVVLTLIPRFPSPIYLTTTKEKQIIVKSSAKQQESTIYNDFCNSTLSSVNYYYFKYRLKYKKIICSSYEIHFVQLAKYTDYRIEAQYY